MNTGILRLKYLLKHPLSIQLVKRIAYSLYEMKLLFTFLLSWTVKRIAYNNGNNNCDDELRK